MAAINPGHLCKAARHSLAGLAHACRAEQAFRHELLVLALLCATLAIMNKPFGDWLLAVGGWLCVMITELLNSAVEEAFDLISTEWNARIKAGKDMASAAVFLAVLINVGIWVRVFLL